MQVGELTFSTQLDNDQLEQDLAAAKREISGMEEDLNQKTGERDALSRPIKDAEAAVESLRKQLAQTKAEMAAGTMTQNVGATRSDILTAQLDKKTAQRDGLIAEQQRLNAEITNATAALAQQKTAVSALEHSVRNVAQAQQDTTSGAQIQAEAHKRAAAAAKAQEAAHKKAQKTMRRLTSRIVGMTTSIMVFSRLSQAAMTGLADHMGLVIRANEAASASLAQLKGALLTLAQPLTDVLLPVFTTFIHLLTRLVTALAWAMSKLFGTTLAQSKAAAKALNKQTNALKGAGKAAGQLASFDTIQTLGSTQADGTSGTPRFDFDTDTAASDFQRILDIVTLIGSAFGAWKLNGGLAGGIGGLLTKFAGLYLILKGATTLIHGFWDALENGAGAASTQDIFVGLLALFTGLLVILGPAAAAIALVVGGIALLALGLYDASVNGWNMYNVLLVVGGGLMAVLAAISLLTGNWIPLLVAAILGVVFALTAAYGDAEGIFAAMSDIIAGFGELVDAVIRGDWSAAWDAAVKILKGVVNVLIGILNALIQAAVEAFNRISAAISGVFDFTVPDWVPVVGGKQIKLNLPTFTAPQIPYLAQGAVIPPNREFLAVLGDQRSGTNIEAPLDTIKQALAEVLAESGVLEAGDIRILFTGDLAQLARVLHPVIEREKTRRGASLVKGGVK